MAEPGAAVEPSEAAGVVLHEGWCTKESGSSFMGKTNWRRRWFKLVQKAGVVRLEYYR